MLPPGYRDLAASAQAGLREVWRVAQELGARSLWARSADGAVAAEVTLHGRMTGLTLRPDVLRSYDSETLGEVIAATIRTGQLDARAVYDAELDRSAPPDVARYLALIREACRQ